MILSVQFGPINGHADLVILAIVATWMLAAPIVAEIVRRIAKRWD